MKRVNAWLRKLGLLTLLAISLVGLAMPTPVQAKDVHLSIGLGIPLPVEVVPAPVVVIPAPVIVHRHPVVIAEPYIIHHHLPPGLAKKYYGYHPGHGCKLDKHGKKHKHHW